jgi:hypothetical protein
VSRLALIFFLFPTLALAEGPLSPRLISGPYPSVAAYCAAQRKGTCDETTPAFPALEQPAAPYKSITGLRVTRTDGIGREVVYCELALETAAGFHVASYMLPCDGPQGMNSSYEGVVVDELRVVDLVPGGNPEVLLRVRQDLFMREYSEDPQGNRVPHGFGFDRSYVLVCGVGPSGKARCTPRIPVEDTFDGRGKDALRVKWGMDRQGRFELSGQDGLRLFDTRSWNVLDGHPQPLAFP